MRYAMIFLAMFSALANAEEPARMGRLFLTPAERAGLDILRQTNKAPDKVIKAEDPKDTSTGTAAAPAALQPVVMNGYIRRSDGKNTVWVNDRGVPEKSANQEFSVGRLDNNRVQVTVNKSKSATLKPGQVYDPNTGKIYNYASEAPLPVVTEAEPESVVDKVTKTLGLDDLKKKTSEWVDSFSKPDASTAPGDKQ